METPAGIIKIKRVLSTVYDIVFIALLVFTLYMLAGLIVKIDSESFPSVMMTFSALIFVSYILFGEILFRSTLGKYLFGIIIIDTALNERPSSKKLLKRALLKIIFPVEFLIMLFSKTGRRLGDIITECSVVRRDTRILKPVIRSMIGIAVICFLYFSFSISLGLAVRKSGFYEAGKEYLTGTGTIQITGLPKALNQSRNKVDFVVPVSIENNTRYVQVYLERKEGRWSVYHTDFFQMSLGTSFGYDFTPKDD